MRIGIGMDAHRLGEGRRLVLGGVEITSDRGLVGHSDADVVLHALMDALLGACGAEDIGTRFPDTDSSYEGASSMDLLSEVMGEVTGRGYVVGNIDIVVICEEPKIAPFRARMRRNVARVCGVEPDSVSIKGTTTEGMGFTGRSEGISSMAVVLLED